MYGQERTNVTKPRERTNRRHSKRIRKKMITPMSFLFFCLLLIGTVIVTKEKLKKSIVVKGGVEKAEEIFSEIAIERKEIMPGIGVSNEIQKMKKKNYPKSLIKLYKNNSEAREFVLDYEKNMKKEEGNNIKEIDLSDDISKAGKGNVPLFVQWDERWGYSKYGDDYMAITGCGPTSLSMVYCGLTGRNDYTPLEVAKMADQGGYYVEGQGSSWEMMTEVASEMGLEANNISLDEDCIINSLENDRPIICIMGPGDFTSCGHFIVLKAIDEEGRVLVNDPNSVKRSSKHWNLEKIMPQIKNLWSYSYENNF